MKMKYVVWGLVILLLILHQDFWYWGDTTLVFGFLPVTLLYHAGISLAAGVTWFLAIKFAWPTELNEVVSQRVGSPHEGDSEA